MNGGPVLHIGQGLVEALEILVAGHRHHIFLKQQLLRLEASGVDVGDIVRHHIHLALQSDLPAEADQLRILDHLGPRLLPRDRRLPQARRLAINIAETMPGEDF